MEEREVWYVDCSDTIVDSYLCSKVDSILGATIQQTKFSETKKLILQDESIPTGPIKVISGLDILTGNQVSVESFKFTQYFNAMQVNVVSSVFTTIWMSLV